MKRKSALLIFAAAVVLAAAAGWFFGSPSEEARACFKDNCFSIEIASTPKERSTGLMFRESLPKNEGMLFVFEKEGSYSFWMKNVIIPLDIIWMDKEGRVAYIAENLQPDSGLHYETVNPGQRAKYVLEINGGLAAQIGLTVGDMIEIKY
ncbi:MAG: DUF192 domain-containing protein [Candidatus Paceibacterota bacterium]|jgi:hypothetical protein|nr:DUF192 domain-containing protein [Candidatus Paceibacterota bacterium]